MPTAMPLARIPLVGQAFTVHDGTVLVTVSCACHPDNPPLLLKGLADVGLCQRCRRLYGIMGVQFDRTKGPGLAIGVAVIGKAPDAGANGSGEVDGR